MARLEDIPEPTRSAARDIPVRRSIRHRLWPAQAWPNAAWALVSSAALIHRGDKPFDFGSGEYRAVPDAWDGADILMSHVSINHDRNGYRRDLNVIYPIDRLRELAEEGVIGGVADTHFTVMGSTDPAAMVASADGIAAALHADRVNAVVLTPV